MVGAKIKAFSDVPAGGSDVTSHIVRLRQTGNGVGCECIRPLPLSVLMLGKSYFLWNVEINVSRSSEVNSRQKRFHPFFHQNDCFVIDEIEDSK